MAIRLDLDFSGFKINGRPHFDSYDFIIIRKKIKKNLLWKWFLFLIFILDLVKPLFFIFLQQKNVFTKNKNSVKRFSTKIKTRICSGFLAVKRWKTGILQNQYKNQKNPPINKMKLMNFCKTILKLKCLTDVAEFVYLICILKPIH